MSDAARGGGGRRDYSQNERLASLETVTPIISGELAQVRQRVHDIANSLAQLVAASEQAQDSHEQMARAIDGLRAELRTHAAELGHRIEQHDQRDDDRFTNLGARVLTMEKQLGVYDTRSAEAVRTAEQRHARRTALAAALIGLAGGLCGALAPLLLKL